MPFVDLIPAGIAEENMVKVLREKYDRHRTDGKIVGCPGVSPGITSPTFNKVGEIKNHFRHQLMTARFF